MRDPGVAVLSHHMLDYCYVITPSLEPGHAMLLQFEYITQRIMMHNKMMPHFTWELGLILAMLAAQLYGSGCAAVGPR